MEVIDNRAVFGGFVMSKTLTAREIVKDIKIEECGACPEGCGGELYYPKAAEDCRCHINAPCHSCTSIVLTCNYCGWENETEPYIPPARESYTPYVRTRPCADLGNGKRIYDYDYDSSSGSTMHYTGKYEGPVTEKDILDYFGSGTFGHRGPILYGNDVSGRFSFTKITD